jgi:hypothetical protein
MKKFLFLIFILAGIGYLWHTSRVSTFYEIGHSQKSRLILNFDDRMKDWHMALASTSGVKSMYQLCKRGEKPVLCTESITIFFNSIGDDNELDKALADNDKITSEKEKLEDGSLVMKFDSGTKIGYCRILRFEDDNYTIVYSIERDLFNSERWAYGKSVVREAVLVKTPNSIR